MGSATLIEELVVAIAATAVIAGLSSLLPSVRRFFGQGFQRGGVYSYAFLVVGLVAGLAFTAGAALLHSRNPFGYASLAVGMAIGAAVSALSAVLLFRQPQPAEVGGETEKVKQIAFNPEKVPNDDIPLLGDRELTWSRYVHAVQRMKTQYAALPEDFFDLIVGVNRGGIACADLIGGGDRQNFGMAVVSPDRKLINFRILDTYRDPTSAPTEESRVEPSAARVLVVDTMFKTGSVVEKVRTALKAEGFKDANLYLGLVVLATVAVPGGPGPHALAPAVVKREALKRTTPEAEAAADAAYDFWLRRIVLLGYLSHGIPILPWRK